MTFSSLLKKYRLDRGLTQQELADRVGVTDAYVSLMESGNRTPGRNTAVALAQALGAPVNSFLDSLGFESLDTDRPSFSEFIAGDRFLTTAQKGLLVEMYENLRGR